MYCGCPKAFTGRTKPVDLICVLVLVLVEVLEIELALECMACVFVDIDSSSPLLENRFVRDKNCVLFALCSSNVIYNYIIIVAK